MKQARITVLIALLTLLPGALFAQYEPPTGGEEFYEYTTPATLGRGYSLTDFNSLGQTRMNPALPAELQRVHVGLSYTGLYGTSSPNDGYKGHGGFFGLAVPTRAGVITGSMAALHVPFQDMDLGTTFSMNAGFSKKLYQRLNMGVALNGLVGGADGNSSVGVSADIGAVYDAGDLGFLGDTAIGFALLNSGKWYQPVEDKSAVPSPFTPAVGISSELLKNEDWSLRLGADLRFPSVQNGRLNLGGRLTFRDRVSLYGGWGVDARQLFEDELELRSLAPSVGISIRIASRIPGESRFIEEQGWQRSEVYTNASVAPMYEGVLAGGVGIEAALGVRDTEPPEISVGYERERVDYISPNNDGTQDDLSFALSIEDERYVRSWRLLIYGEENSVVREIENKDDRPENEGLQGIIDRIVAVEKGVEVPDELRWDGRGDGGEVVPDGEYSFVVRASDDNGNSAEIERREFVIDTQPPEVQIAEVSSEQKIFSPNGDGNKDEFTLVQDGSVERLWEAEIANSQGEVVYTRRWERGAPETFTWEGRDDAGALVPDGVYEYRITSTDRAGNSVEERLPNLIINTVSSPVDLTVSHSSFSPNGDGTLDSVELRPSVPVTSGIVEWSLRIESARGEAMRTYSGVDVPPETISFDGRNAAGDRVPEGIYQGVLSVRYQNGNNPTAVSPPMNVDVTPPTADVRVDVPVFSPNNDGIRDQARFFQDASEERQWTGIIRTPEGETVREVTWRGTPEFRYEWDGRTEEGRVASDGRYEYVLSATDAAGNSGSSTPVVVNLDTSEAELFVSASEDAFSPNADGTLDQLIFFPRVQEELEIESYELRVSDRNG
ncbi:MAG: FlgD immunoglobulin-like domain containing protein, partial [Alkalispirochaetaceae bacterium]